MAVLLCAPLAAEEDLSVNQGKPFKNSIVPLTFLFHDFGWNILGTLTHNYGLNFAAAGIGTALFIDTGIDWNFRNLVYENQGIANAGIPALYAAYFVPPIAPVVTYITGRILKNERMQIAGLALTQALGITLSFQSVLKMTTGRSAPGIIDGHGHARNSRTDDFSTEFDWFNMNLIDGWPSGHTANSFAAAAVIGEIYHDKPLLVAGVYTYAALIGLSMGVSVHWISEVLAGALIGFAVGKTVGKSYRALLENSAAQEQVSWYATANKVGVIIRW
ncbi:MAG: phosphatase PAP2 family protein [Spirochaetaceae bacterium]|nr:phosphatase PAP2 family protein [Spirochaetaceae bacterium]